MQPDPTRPYLAWYRPAVLERLVRIAVLSATVMTLGMAMLGVGIWSWRIGPATRPFVIGVGAAATLYGPLSMILRFHRLLMREDGYLGLHVDGVDIHLGEPATFVAWDDLVGVHVEVGVGGAKHEGPLELRLRNGEILQLWQEWSGTTRSALARELETTRKRAGLGLIRIPTRS